jgi:hypothetical protein
MILVTGSVMARRETFDEVRRLSLEHVHRSRAEPGCMSHAVHVDCDNPLRLVLSNNGPTGPRFSLISPCPHRGSSSARYGNSQPGPQRLRFTMRARLKSCERVKMHGCVATPNPILRCSIESPRYAPTH